MHADTFFTGCQSHSVCQDYARSGSLKNKKIYSIVSDGCSSSIDTDFGSRLLTIAAKNTLEECDIENILPKPIIENAKSYIEKTNLEPYCLDATLLIACENKNKGITVKASGDGTIVAKRGKIIDIFDIGYDGAPGYLSYLLDSKRMEAYASQGFGKRTVNCINNGIFSESPILTLDFFDFDFVMICTDGIHSFQHSETLEPIDYKEIIQRIIDFRVFTGQFVTRRLRHLLDKECTELKWKHNDDVGIAAIYKD